MVRSLLRRVLGPAGKQAASPSQPALESPPRDSRERARSMVLGIHDDICSGLEALYGESRFTEVSWERPEGGWTLRSCGMAGSLNKEVNLRGAGPELPLQS